MHNRNMTYGKTKIMKIHSLHRDFNYLISLIINIENACFTSVVNIVCVCGSAGANLNEPHPSRNAAIGP